jgi:hypothetical protein
MAKYTAEYLAKVTKVVEAEKARDEAVGIHQEAQSHLIGTNGAVREAVVRVETATEAADFEFGKSQNQSQTVPAGGGPNGPVIPPGNTGSADVPAPRGDSGNLKQTLMIAFAVIALVLLAIFAWQISSNQKLNDHGQKLTQVEKTANDALKLGRDNANNGEVMVENLKDHDKRITKAQITAEKALVAAEKCNCRKEDKPAPKRTHQPHKPVSQVPVAPVAPVPAVVVVAPQAPAPVAPPVVALVPTPAPADCKNDCKNHETNNTVREEKRSDGRCFIQTNMGYRFELKANTETGKLMVAMVDPSTLKKIEGTRAYMPGDLATKDPYGYDCDGMQSLVYKKWDEIRESQGLPSACRLVGQPPVVPTRKIGS